MDWLTEWQYLKFKVQSSKFICLKRAHNRKSEVRYQKSEVGSRRVGVSLLLVPPSPCPLAHRSRNFVPCPIFFLNNRVSS